jgi:coenzyme F420-reducing hydrogenase delta subunit
LSPSFIDYVLTKRMADGVVLTGCTEGGCNARFGIEWTTLRVARERDPYLRRWVPRERIRTAWVGRRGRKQLLAVIDQFSRELAAMPALVPFDTPILPEPNSVEPRDKVDA